MKSFNLTQEEFDAVVKPPKNQAAVTLGQRSAEVRFEGLSEEQISNKMRALQELKKKKKLKANKHR